MTGEEGVDLGALVVQNTDGELEWYFGPTQRVPFGEECIHCGEDWSPSCVSETRSFAFSKQGRAAFDRLRETGGQWTDVRHFADWMIDWQERMQREFRDMSDEETGSLDETYVESMRNQGGTPDRHIDEIRFSGFETMPIESVADHVSGQRFEGSTYANLSLLIHAISFGQVRSGELRSNPELDAGMDDIVTKCHTIMQNDTEGVLYYRHLQGRCWICGRDISADERAPLGIACEDGMCAERLGGDPNIIRPRRPDRDRRDQES